MRLIDADALLEKINGLKRTSNWRAAVVVSIINLPTIDPVKHGRWVYAGSSIEKVYECSECGQVEFGEEHDDYCPNCGARMDGEEDGID